MCSGGKESEAAMLWVAANICLHTTATGTNTHDHGPGRRDGQSGINRLQATGKKHTLPQGGSDNGSEDSARAAWVAGSSCECCTCYVCRPACLHACQGCTVYMGLCCVFGRNTSFQPLNQLPAVKRNLTNIDTIYL